MISETCYTEQKEPVQQEDGVTIDTHTKYPDREKKSEQLTDDAAANPTNVNTANNVVTESMGPGYPGVI